MELQKDNMLTDTFVVVHVARQELRAAVSRQKDVNAYIKRIQRRIELYLQKDKPVYFTLLSLHVPSEFEQYKERVMFVPIPSNRSENAIVMQGRTIRNNIITNSQGQVVIEFAGGYKFACYGTTVSAILKGSDVSASILKEQCRIHNHQIEKYRVPTQTGIIRGGWALVENIF